MSILKPIDGSVITGTVAGGRLGQGVAFMGNGRLVFSEPGHNNMTGRVLGDGSLLLLPPSDVNEKDRWGWFLKSSGTRLAIGSFPVDASAGVVDVLNNFAPEKHLPGGTGLDILNLATFVSDQKNAKVTAYLPNLTPRVAQSTAASFGAFVAYLASEHKCLIGAHGGITLWDFNTQTAIAAPPDTAGFGLAGCDIPGVGFLVAAPVDTLHAYAAVFVLDAKGTPVQVIRRDRPNTNDGLVTLASSDTHWAWGSPADRGPSGNSGGSVLIFKNGDNVPQYEYYGPRDSETGTALAFSPDGKQLAVGCPGFDLVTTTPTVTTTPNVGRVLRLAIA